MLSIPNFIQGIETDNPTHDVTHNFGKMMVLYRLLGGIPNLSISTTHEDGTVFSIQAKTKKDANSVNEYINGISYRVYGSNYRVMSVCEQKSIKVKISKI